MVTIKGKISQGNVLKSTIKSSGASKFTSLTDTPSSYTGFEDYFVKVNSAGTAVEFTLSSASVSWGEVTGTLSDQSDLQAALDLKYDSADFNVDWDAVLATKDTDDLAEGSNLYYTDARVDSHLSGGTGVTYSAGTISIGQSVETSDTVEFANVKTKQIAAISVPSPAADTSIPLGPWKDVAATISKIRYFCLPSGATVDFNIEERGATTPGTVGTDVLSADVSAVETPAETTSFANASIGADANLHLVCSAITGTPTDLLVVVYGKED